MGRAPCCDKANVKKGPWSPEEDSKLKSYIQNNGIGGNWIALPQKIGLKRCGKSCRLRWLNYLRPNLKHGGFSEEEDNIICTLYTTIGSRWSIIAAQLPGRTDNDIKNYWNTRLKKKLLGKQRKEQQARRVIKQETSKMNDQIDHHHNHHGYFMSDPDQTVNIIYPYWPELPVTTSELQNPVQDPHHDIKNLLAKIGGRFSDQQQEQQIMSSEFQNPYDQLYDNSNNSMMNNNNNNNASEVINNGGMSYYCPAFNNDDVFCGNVDNLGTELITDGSDHRQMGINGSSTTTTSTSPESSYSNWADLVSAPNNNNVLDHHTMYSTYEQEMMMMLQRCI